MGRLAQTPTLRGHKRRLRTQIGITPIPTDEVIEPLPKAAVTSAILVQRGQRVILDRDLAALYGVTTKRLNEAVKRNGARFPEDFVFRLSAEEAAVLRSQLATSRTPARDGRGGARYQPFAFTEHGAIQAANVLSSPRAVEMGLYVVRAFVRLRKLLASNQELAKRLDQLEARIEKTLATHDDAIAAMLSAIRELMQLPPAKRRGIGFTAEISNPE